MEENGYRYKGTKKLAYGYTTGTCAAAAAQAACIYHFTGVAPEAVDIDTPGGICLRLEVVEAYITETGASVCAIQKQSGDDPDVTNGVLVYAETAFQSKDYKMTYVSEKERVLINGGVGVGRVTKPGLDQPVGAAAINSVPRQMITHEVLQVCEEFEYCGLVKVIISIPKGVELAEKTFNPRLGIEGGISVLGTSGIVEPMSEKALIDTIRVEMKVRREENNKLLLTAPGNYGRGFMQDKYGIDIDAAVKCSNYIGETIDIANELGFERMLLVGHIGKLIKVSGGIMNTHSSCADARLELLAAHGIRAGADLQTARAILDCVTTEEALSILSKAGLLEKTMQIAMDKIAYYIGKRTDWTQIEIILFSNEQGELARTAHAMDYLEKYRHGTFCRSGSGSTGSDYGER